MAALTALPREASAHLVSGKVVTYRGEPVSQRPVTVSYSYWVYNGYGACHEQWDTHSATTDAGGQFSVTVPKKSSVQCQNGSLWTETEPGVYEKMMKPDVLMASAWGSETGSLSCSSTSSNIYCNGDVTRAPDMIGPSGYVWARRIGRGRDAVVFIEGFDPKDTTKTQTGNPANPGIVELLQATQLAGPTRPDVNLLSHLSNHYTLWILATGYQGGQDIRLIGRDAMRLAKAIKDKHHPSGKMAIGGYSMGGLVARYGTAAWCGGSLAGYGLTVGCPELSLAYFLDAPLEGATIPVSLQRYLRDTDVCDSTCQWENTYELDAIAAGQMLRQHIAAHDDCDTNCYDAGGCDSDEDDFEDNCVLDSGPRTAFMSELVGLPLSAHGYPMRGASGVRVPAISLSLGTSPTAPGEMLCSSPSSTAKYMYTYLWGAFCGNHDLYLNTAGGSNECLNGSTLNTLASSDGKQGSLPFPCNGYTVHMIGEAGTAENAFPTFIPSESALDWGAHNRHLDAFKDYFHHTTNIGHKNAMPLQAARMVAGYLHEYLKGTASQKPLCGYLGGNDGGLGSGLQYRGGGLRFGCRTGGAEILGNGIDDDGDEMVDEGATCGDALCGAGETSQSCWIDCGETCGNGRCGGGETGMTCKQDCDVCGNGFCGPTESSALCPNDCGAVCGDGVCTTGESCAEDCGCPPSCFAAGTRITMADGGSRKIEDVHEGDEVLAFDTAAGVTVPARVTRTFVHAPEQTPRTLLVDGALRVTPEHPFYANGQWVRADELGTGATLVRIADQAPPADGGAALSAPVESIAEMAGGITTYNIEVETFHDYFAGGVLVHNKPWGCGGPID